MIQALARARQLLAAQAQKAQLGMMPELQVGPGSLYDVPDLLRDQDIRCVTIVTTQGFVKRGVIGSFTKDLMAHGIAAAVFADVTADPDFECAEMAAAFFRSHGCEGIVAIGGGSVMDCAKVAGALAMKPRKKARDLVGTMKVRTTLPYLIAVPTTAGTGSEVTAAAVLTDPERQRKFAVADLALIPDAAVLDPNLLVGLPPDMTAYTGMDALTHAVEAYTNRYGSHEARKYAREAVELIFENLKASYDDGANAKLRENMLVASYCAGIAFTTNMVGYVHALAHGLGGRYHVQHGLANAVLLPLVMEEFGASAEIRLAELARAIGVEDTDRHELARKFIARIRELADSVGIPDTLPEIREEDLAELAEGALQEGNPAYPVPEIWDAGRFRKVLRRAAGLGEEAAGARAATDVAAAPAPEPTAPAPAPAPAAPAKPGIRSALPALKQAPSSVAAAANAAADAAMATPERKRALQAAAMGAAAASATIALRQLAKRRR